MKMLPHEVGKLALAKPKTDDQQEVGSACERQDGKRVVRGSNARHCVKNYKLRKANALLPPPSEVHPKF